METINEEYLEHLTYQLAVGDLSADEADLVDRWGNTSPGRRSFLERIQNKERVMASLIYWQQIDVERSHARWIRRRRKQRVRSIMRYATAACLVIAAGLTFYHYRDRIWPQKAAVPVAATKVATTKHEALPARNTAILTLANGKQVLLDSVATGKFITEGNTQLSKTDTNLVYPDRAAFSGELTSQTIAYHTLSAPRAGQYRLTLPDGTRVWLNSASQLRYPTVFTGKQRRVELTGEAYFDVKKNKIPFIVQAYGQSVEVLGTSFNVMAYNDEDSIQTTLVTGAVRVVNGKQTVVLLRPGQQAAGKLGAGGLHVREVNGKVATAWKDGLFYFPDNTDLQTVLRSLARWYDVKIDWQCPVINPVGYGGKFERNIPLKDVLIYLKHNDINLTVTGDRLVITRPAGAGQ